MREALVALAGLRDTLHRYNLNINDAKTKVMPGIEPLNEVWAQDLRFESRRLRGYPKPIEDIVLFLNKALGIARELGSDSPVKIALRTMDQIRAYSRLDWDTIEPYLQRTLFHHPHCIDYVALLVVKRVALDRDIDREGWGKAACDLLMRHLPLNHHHEVVWLSWLMLSARLEIADDLVADLSANENAHIRALVIAAHIDGRIKRRPPIKLGSKLATTDSNWLVNLVAKATGYSGASFSGQLSAEFDHLAKKKVKLIDFKAHMKAAQETTAHAISRTRYGYDSDDDDSDYDYDYSFRRHLDDDDC